VVDYLRGLSSFPTRRSSDLRRSPTGRGSSRGSCGAPSAPRGPPTAERAERRQAWIASGDLNGFLGLALDNVTQLVILSSLLIGRSEEHTSELQSRENLVCRL